MSLIFTKREISFLLQLGRLPVELAALNDCMEEVEMLFPLTSPIPGVPNWSVHGVISHAKLECKKPLVWHVYLEFPCHTKYSMDILCFTVILFRSGK